MNTTKKKKIYEIEFMKLKKKEGRFKLKSSFGDILHKNTASSTRFSMDLLFDNIGCLVDVF